METTNKKISFLNFLEVNKQGRFLVENTDDLGTKIRLSRNTMKSINDIGGKNHLPLNLSVRDDDNFEESVEVQMFVYHCNDSIVKGQIFIEGRIFESLIGFENNETEAYLSIHEEVKETKEKVKVEVASEITLFENKPASEIKGL